MGARVRLGAPDVGGGVDQEREVLGEHQPQQEGENEHTEHVAGEQSENHSRADVDDGADGNGVAVLPAENRVLQQIGDIRGVIVLGALHHDPAHVRVEESFLRVVGVVVGIDKAVVEAVRSSPRNHAVFICSRAEDRKEGPDGRGSAVSAVGKEAVVAGSDRETGDHPQTDAGSDLHPGHAVSQHVPGHCDECRNRRQRQEQSVAPDDRAFGLWSCGLAFFNSHEIATSWGRLNFANHSQNHLNTRATKNRAAPGRRGSQSKRRAGWKPAPQRRRSGCVVREF